MTRQDKGEGGRVWVWVKGYEDVGRIPGTDGCRIRLQCVDIQTFGVKGVKGEG